MPAFPPLEDQLALIVMGAAEILPLDGLDERHAASIAFRLRRAAGQRSDA